MHNTIPTYNNDMRFQYIFSIAVSTSYGKIDSVDLDGFIPSVVNNFTLDYSDTMEIIRTVDKLHTILVSDDEVKSACGINRIEIDNFAHSVSALRGRCVVCGNVEGLFVVKTPTEIGREVIGGLIQQHLEFGTIDTFLKECKANA